MIKEAAELLKAAWQIFPCCASAEIRHCFDRELSLANERHRGARV
jgi:hypothetical protein